MGLVAYVHCDCFARGALRTEPDPAWTLEEEDSGAVWLAPGHEDEEQLTFERWKTEACPHPDMVVLRHTWGNREITEVRAALEDHGARFRYLLDDVFFSGGDGRSCADDELERLGQEVAALAELDVAGAAGKGIRALESRLRELVAAARQLERPILFE